jgi:hypothetical protein
LWGIGSKLFKWTIVERKKREGKFGACLLVSHLGKEECVKTYKMKLGWCDNQGHLINKSHSQVKQCKWFSANEANFKSWTCLKHYIHKWLDLAKRLPPSFL